jgi:hypothetical protein
VSEWISVKQELPENGRKVLIFMPTVRVIYQVWMDAKENRFRDSDGWWPTSAPSHWMPLPEPPDAKA